MFSFLNPIALFGLAGLAVPVWIHFFARPKPKVIDFPSTVFLSRVQIEHMKRIKIRELWLLILRCLAVLFLVLAAARPSLKSGAGYSPASFVFVVDNSLSMSREGLWTLVRTRADSALNAVRKGDEVSLVWTAPPEVAAARLRDPDAVRRLILESKCGWARGSMSAALDSASGLLAKSSCLNRAVVLISDFQSTEFADSLKALPDRTVFFALPAAGDSDNAAVSDAGLETRILEPGAEAGIRIEASNHSKSRIETAVGVELNGEPAAQSNVTLEPGSSRKLTLRVMPRSGWNEGEIRINGDALAGDNIRAFVFYVPETIRVLVAGASTDVRPVILALAPGGGSGLFRIDRISLGESLERALSGADVVHLCDWPSPNPSESAALGRFIESGGGAFFWFGDRTRPADWDAWMRPRFGIRLKGDVPVSGGSALSKMDFTHPLFKGVFDETSDRLHPVRVDRMVLADPGKAAVILSASDRNPLLVQTGFGRGRALVFLSGLDLQWSGMALSTLFAPLVHRGTVELAGSASDSPEPVRAGGMLVFSCPPDYGKPYHIQLPDGGKAALMPDQRGGRDVLSWPAREPGVYRFFRTDSLIGLASVVVDPAESDLRSISPEAFRSRIRVPVRWIENGGIAREAAAVRFGRELWKEALFFAVLCLLVEMAVARIPTSSREKRKK